MSRYCPYIDQNIVYTERQECDITLLPSLFGIMEDIVHRDWYICKKGAVALWRDSSDLKMDKIPAFGPDFTYISVLLCLSLSAINKYRLSGYFTYPVSAQKWDMYYVSNSVRSQKWDMFYVSNPAKDKKWDIFMSAAATKPPLWMILIFAVRRPCSKTAIMNDFYPSLSEGSAAKLSLWMIFPFNINMRCNENGVMNGFLAIYWLKIVHTPRIVA